MRKNVSFIDEFAVSEVVGAMILVLIAIVAFAAIYLYVFPLPIPPPEPNVKLMGYVNDDGTAVIEHIGGEPLLSYKIYADGKLVYQNDKKPWKISECINPSLDKLLLTENDKVKIDVYETCKDGSENQVFTGILKGKEGHINPPCPLCH